MRHPAMAVDLLKTAVLYAASQPNDREAKSPTIQCNIARQRPETALLRRVVPKFSAADDVHARSRVQRVWSVPLGTHQR